MCADLPSGGRVDGGGSAVPAVDEDRCVVVLDDHTDLSYFNRPSTRHFYDKEEDVRARHAGE